MNLMVMCGALGELLQHYLSRVCIVQYRTVNRLANLIEPVMGSVSPVVTSKPVLCNQGQGKTVLIQNINHLRLRAHGVVLSKIVSPTFTNFIHERK